ncbi:tripartite tricarboxylate transporter substrate binding protein [Variovorax sp. YR216]|uniref:Bug family tripartite tricarboxylate transporter substrate binding protein n=1 Tax=Variovorax sp. YR216 TaxID=1882828 RepID=UPI002108B698|nr:tripartite tricarboxylate transporter substrate binding protein [Variovorax sp. YR216]
MPATRRAAIAAAVFMSASLVFAQGDTWPSRPITMIVPSSAGSGTDLMAREMAHRLGMALGQSIVVENKAGGSGIIGTQAVVRAAADGYTLLYTNATNMVMAPALMKSVPYDVTKDLAPVAQTAAGGVFLLVSNDLPARNLKELVELVKSSPGKFTFGSWAVGSSGHMTMEWLKRQTGMKIDHVPYRQVPQLLTELTTGTLKIGFADPAAPLPFMESGRLRAIAVTGTVRLPRAASVPTFAEQGYAFEPVGWFGVFAPPGTPAAIVQRLNTEINKIQQQPDMVAKVTAMNIAPPPTKSPDAFRSMMIQDLQMWKRIVADTGITVDN